LSDQPTQLLPPTAKRVPHPTTLHDETRQDDYFWLREKENPEVSAYLTAENDYATTFLQPTEAMQKRLYDEMLARIQETDLSVPYRLGDFFYYTRTEEGKQYPIYCRKPGSVEAIEEITLDVNALADGHKFCAVGMNRVSDDADLLAYSVDFTGFREYTLYVKNLQTGELLPDTIEKVGLIAWAADNKTLFYTTEDSAKRPYRIYRHTLGSNEPDTLIYEEPDGLYRAFLYRSKDKKYIFLGSAASTSTEIRFFPADNPTAEARLICPRELEHEYSVDHRDGLLYIRTNKGAVNFRLMTAPITAPEFDNWKELIPHRPHVMIEDIELFRDYLVLSERTGGLPRLQVRNLVTNAEHAITFPEPTYSVSTEANFEFETNLLRFRYASFITPASVFDYDMETRERVLLKETPVLGGYDRTKYTSEFIHATATDGTLIPISIVYRNGFSKDGYAPLLLYGYGSYGISIPVGFNSNRLSLLDRGVVYAVAHIRGGGELGKPWHDAGKMKNKRNTFTDFIACAEHLIAHGYTSRQRLAIMGGSAGGLLMGAVSNMRPELFHTVMSYVPFVDVLNTMLDDTLPLTIGEYLEWGNPNKLDEYAYMRTYCPYTNLEAKAYPVTLIRTSLNDSQVMYWEPAKYVAKLRTLKTDTNPLLLLTNMDAGHGGSSGRYDALKEIALDYAFLLWRWGITE
jgi:oligopeptidase B